MSAVDLDAATTTDQFADEIAHLVCPFNTAGRTGLCGKSLLGIPAPTNDTCLVCIDLCDFPCVTCGELHAPPRTA